MARQPRVAPLVEWKYTSLLRGDPFAIGRTAQGMCGTRWRYLPTRSVDEGLFSCDNEQAMDEMKRLYPVEDL